jgi:hypothetical protein
LRAVVEYGYLDAFQDLRESGGGGFYREAAE